MAVPDGLDTEPDEVKTTSDFEDGERDDRGRDDRADTKGDSKDGGDDPERVACDAEDSARRPKAMDRPIVKSTLGPGIRMMTAAVAAKATKFSNGSMNEPYSRSVPVALQSLIVRISCRLPTTAGPGGPD